MLENVLKQPTAVPMIVLTRHQDQVEAINKALRNAGHPVHPTWLPDARELGDALTQIAPEILVFFADEGDGAECGGEGVGDDGLSGEVTDGDGALVVLGDGSKFVEAGLDVAADGGGLSDGEACGGEEGGGGTMHGRFYWARRPFRRRRSRQACTHSSTGWVAGLRMSSGAAGAS